MRGAQVLALPRFAHPLLQALFFLLSRPAGIVRINRSKFFVCVVPEPYPIDFYLALFVIGYFRFNIWNLIRSMNYLGIGPLLS